MHSPYHIYWGDTHHQSYIPVQDPPLSSVLEQAGRYLDFYSGAYYMKQFSFARPIIEQCVGEAISRGHLHENPTDSNVHYRGVHLENSKPSDLLAREWAEVQEATAAANSPGSFVTFPGYEWQGNGRWGDHNVIYRREGFDLCNVLTLPELYAYLRGLAVDAFAIPHHTGYLTGQRAPNWANCDETLSPYAEIFSIHGCSETDEEWIGLRHNPHMGPGAGGSTWQDALDAGLHLGAICSTDNWTMMPAHWGQGLMAVLAQELTRDALWDAFRNRRVYGVSGDRIELDFTCNDAPMGSILPATDERHILVSVRAADAIDRIELLRSDCVIATHNHQGSWQMPAPGTRTSWTVRVEIGWGPRSAEIPVPDVLWLCTLSVDGGRMLSWQPCWVTPGQSVPRLRGETAAFEIVTGLANAARDVRNALVLEFEAEAGSTLHLHANELALHETIGGLAGRSRLLWDASSSQSYLNKVAGVTPEMAAHTDAYYHYAHKVKVHRAMPEAARTATLTFVDDEPLRAETYYRVRVEQRNGQRAWSSPIWVGT